jgi:3-dehydroquinate synthetase
LPKAKKVTPRNNFFSCGTNAANNMDLYNVIKEKSIGVDWTKKDISVPLSIIFSVPTDHPRHSKISQYSLVIKQLSDFNFGDAPLILCDQGIKKYLPERFDNLSNIIFLNPTEGKLKILQEADNFVKSHKEGGLSKIIAVGGGIIANFAGYVAEKLAIDLAYVPTTVVSMSDASIGGKVRINDIQKGVFIKHAYKSFYEPSEIILDPQFLESLTDEQIRTGIAEIIKHAIYQSPLLTEYLLSDFFQPFKDKKTLLRAILWAADLKRICLEVDPKESKNGAYKILRAAHEISDKLEEQSKFTLPHGQAVEEAMLEDLRSDKEKFDLLSRIYHKLSIS